MIRQPSHDHLLAASIVATDTSAATEMRKERVTMKSEKVVLYADRKPMKGVANPGPHQMYCHPHLEVEQRELSEVGVDDIRVEMIYAGLCGTDLHLVEENRDTGYVRGSAPAEIPAEGRVMGHEGVGRIIETGSNVRHVQQGDFVTFESILVCHYCDMCRKGQFNQCRKAKLLGLEQDGLFGPVVNVPAMLAHNIRSMAKSEDGLKAAACIEPAGVAYVACENSRIVAGNTVVIFGAGPIGVLAAMLSKTVFGASLVHMVEPIEFRRKLASQWCDQVFDVEEYFQSAEQPVDVVIEASGYLSNVQRIFRSVNADGRIVLLARSGEPLTLDAVDHMITNAITVVGSRGHLGGAIDKIITLYCNGQLPLHEIVTEVVEGSGNLKKRLNAPEEILSRNCKVLGRFSGAIG